MNYCPIVSFECAGDGYAEQVGEWIANPHAYFKSFGPEARTFQKKYPSERLRTWRLCIRRYYLEEGMRALFVSDDALLPSDDERFDNSDVCKLHERVFRFGFGVKERRKFPFVKRNVYHNNCGVLYPLDDFHELLKAKVGDVCAAELQIESAAEMHRRATAPKPKKKAVFQPKSVKADFLAKLRLHRKRYGW